VTAPKPLDTGRFCTECGVHRSTVLNPVCPVCATEPPKPERYIVDPDLPPFYSGAA
jgi:hypothetical protein